jgi:hypothetical protein
MQYKYWKAFNVHEDPSAIEYVSRAQGAVPLPTYVPQQPVVQQPMWKDALNDIQGWLGNPSIPDFNPQGSTLGSFLPF